MFWSNWSKWIVRKIVYQSLNRLIGLLNLWIQLNQVVGQSIQRCGKWILHYLLGISELIQLDSSDPFSAKVGTICLSRLLINNALHKLAIDIVLDIVLRWSANWTPFEWKQFRTAPNERQFPALWSSDDSDDRLQAGHQSDRMLGRRQGRLSLVVREHAVSKRVEDSLRDRVTRRA